jgi:lysophospholipase L1-like esterase
VTFLETLDADRPSFVAIQIGVEDIRQAGAACGSRCSNVSEFVRLFTEHIIAPIVQRNIPAAIISVGLDGECTNEGNALDEKLDKFADAQLAMAYANGLAFVDLRTAEIDYETNFNCLNLTSGPLTTDGVLPNARGVALLAESVADGILDAVKAPLAPRPPPKPAGGRIWLTSAPYNITGAPGGGVAAADAACTREAGGAPARALIADAAGCGGQPCRRGSVTPFRGDGQVDWPLKPNRLYYRLDNETSVGFTDEAGLLVYPIYAGPSDTCLAQATGLASDWTTTDQCDSWSNASAALDDAGVACSRLPRLMGSTAGAISGGMPLCASLSFLCVAGL